MQKPIPVAQVINTLNRGGAETLLVSIANQLDEQRFQSYVITLQGPGSLANALVSGVHFYSLLRGSVLNLQAMKALIAFLESNQIQIVHTHSHTSAYYIRLAGMFSSWKPLHIIHDHHGPITATPWIRLLDRLLLRNIDYYLGVSENLTAYARTQIGLSADKCQYLANGVLIPANIEKTKSEKFTIVQVARVEPVKNQLMAIQTAAILKKMGCDFVWYLVGRLDANSQAYTQACKDAVAEHGLEQQVIFTGEQQDVQSFLRKADLGVLTSRYEGLPMAILEYMAWGLPVIATDTGACRQVLENVAGNTVVAVDDAAGFARSIRSVMAAPAAMTDVDLQNREYVEKYYSLQTMIEKIMLIYDNCLLAKSPGMPQ